MCRSIVYLVVPAICTFRSFMFFFFFKQKTAYEMRISDWSSDVCSSDLTVAAIPGELIERRARFYICGAPQAILQTKRDPLARAVFPFEIFEERFRSPRPDRKSVV